MISPAANPLPALRIRGARLFRCPTVRDARGALAWAEAGTHLPFEPQRFWSIYDVPPGQTRGGHAHRALHEVLVCLRGRCTIALDDGAHRDETVLDAPDLALYVPPLVWNTQSGFSADALLLVLASEPYRADDYIRDRAELLALAARAR